MNHLLLSVANSSTHYADLLAVCECGSKYANLRMQIHSSVRYPDRVKNHRTGPGLAGSAIVVVILGFWNEYFALHTQTHVVRAPGLALKFI